MRRFTSGRLRLLGLGAVVVLLAGCTGSEPGSGAGTGSSSPSPSTTAATSPSPSASATNSPTPTDTPTPTSYPTPTDSPSPSASASSTPTPTPTPTRTEAHLLRAGSSGADVLAVQQRLVELGYWLGEPDGEYGTLTVQAVTAVQKVAGIERDGVVGPSTRRALDRGRRAKARSTSGDVIEIDLRRQVLLVVRNGTVRQVLNASSGSGEWYTRPDGSKAHAVTPRGRYAIFRSVDGWDSSPLGELYRPRYFNSGIAVHGHPSVPAHPASHGCVRVSIPAMDMIWRDGLASRGTPVRVY